MGTYLSNYSIGYAPFAAGLYTNNRYGVEWLTIFGAALCGISAGIFWMAEAAIAISYPEPWNRGKALGYWLTYRLSGQILGGAISLGINAHRAEAGSVSYNVYLVFIALQATGPFVALLLNPPAKVERQDGKKVELTILANPWSEMRQTAKDFLRPQFLLIVLWIGQAVFAEAVYFTYLSGEFSTLLSPISNGRASGRTLAKFSNRVVHGPIASAWFFPLGNMCRHCRKPARCKLSDHIACRQFIS